MIINEIPEKILINLGETAEEWEEATVIAIFPKLHYGSESGVEGFIALCYTADKSIYEIHLNETKILKTRKYEQTGSTWNPFKENNRRRRKKNFVRNNNPSKREKFESEGESDSGRKRDGKETDGGES